MIIKLHSGKVIQLPDDTKVSESCGSYYFQKPTAERMIESANTYFVIPVRNVLYYRVENNTVVHGDVVADFYAKTEK